MADNLSFEELRKIAFRHLEGKIKVYSGSTKLVHPDPYWLKEELAEILSRLKNNQASYEIFDFLSAYYSVIFELETGKQFFVDSLIYNESTKILARLISFCHEYPVRAKVL